MGSPPHAPLGHVGLTVPDVDRAVRWYEDVFGWRLLAGPLEASTDDPRVCEQLKDVFKARHVAFRQAHMLAGDIAVELFEFARPRVTRGRGRFDYWNVGIFHLCVVVAAIDELAAQITAAGGRQCSSVSAIFPGEPFRFCYCEDPFGNTIELATHSHADAFAGRTAY